MRFNGATAVEPWKFDGKTVGIDEAFQLQWGHGC